MPRNKRLLIVGSLPPPYSGYETATEVLMSSGLDAFFDLHLVNTRTTRNPSHRGRVSASNLLATGRVLVRLVVALLRFRPHIANVPLAQNRTGFLKWMSMALVCRLGGAKVVSRLGGGSFDRFYQGSTPFMQRLIRFGLRLPATLVVRGPSLKDQFAGLVATDRISVVPNGFDVKKWQKGLVSRQVNSSIRVLYLGQVSKAKGVFDLIEAIARLSDRERDGFSFKIAGPIIERERNILHVDSPESTSAAIQALLTEHAVSSGAIEFTGEVSWDEKRRLYRWADVLVLPSYSEGFPYTVLEAFASGCAVICTQVGALPDYLEDGREVLFVPVATPSALAEALRKIRDDKVRKILAENGMRYLEDNHDCPVFVSRMAELFNGVTQAQ